MSSTMLIPEAIARKTTGERLSPSDRMIAAVTLYRNVVGIPRKIMTMYTYAYSKISSGVCISVRSGRQQATIAVVITTEKITHSHALFATKRRSSESLFAPNICETGIAKPLQTPVQKPITRKFKELVEPTPASGPTPRNLPTITVSTIL